jgi:histidinol phosphatase-like PHP family hydrolase
VRDKAGAPIPDAAVALVGSALTATSDARGEFTLVDVPEGVVKLRVAVNGKERVVELRVPDSAYVVEM